MAHLGTGGRSGLTIQERIRRQRERARRARRGSLTAQQQRQRGQLGATTGPPPPTSRLQQNVVVGAGPGGFLTRGESQEDLRISARGGGRGAGTIATPGVPGGQLTAAQQRRLQRFGRSSISQRGLRQCPVRLHSSRSRPPNAISSRCPHKRQDSSTVTCVWYWQRCQLSGCHH